MGLIVEGTFPSYFEVGDRNKLVVSSFDSLYIVVFFSEEIICRGGPESFSGLPGMILGVAIPQMHITWFAKRVSAKPAYKEPFNSENSNTLSFNEYKKQLFSECKNYGEIAKWYYLFSLL